MDTIKKFPNLDDLFNELWMYTDQKDFKEAYKDIQPASHLSKTGNTKLTKFLISLGDRLQKHKNSSIESDEIAKDPKERKESLTTSEKSLRDEGHERKPDSSSSPRISKEEASRPQSNLITHRKFSDQRPSPLQGNLLISLEKDKDADPHYKKGGSVERTSHATPKSKVGSAKKRTSLSKGKQQKYNKRKSFLQSLLSEMPRLDDFKPVESVNFPVNILRFGDESIHTVYEWMKQPVEEGKLEDKFISKVHNFKTSFVKIKHDKFDKMYYGVDESDVEDDLSEDLGPVKSDKSLSDTSEDDESGPKRYHYQRFKIPSFGDELYKFERKFNRYLEKKLKKTYQDLFGFKEPIYCDFANPTLIQEARRRYIKKIFDEPRNRSFRKIRERHDKSYKTEEDTSGCKKVQGMDDIRRAEYLLEKFLRAEKDFKPSSETFEDTGLTKKKLEKLEKLFKFETDKPIDALMGTSSISSITLKLEESAAQARSLLRETIYDVFLENVFDDNFDRLVEIESDKHDPGMRLKPKERFSMTSLISESEDDMEEEKVAPFFTTKKMIVSRDFTKAPFKVIKALEKLGFLYEGTLYEKPDHPLYKMNIREERKSTVTTLDKMQYRRSSSKHASPLVTKKPVIQKPKPATGGIQYHKDSLGKIFRTKKKITEGESKESLASIEEFRDEDENEVQSTIQKSDMKKNLATQRKLSESKTANLTKGIPPLIVQTSETLVTSPVEEVLTNKGRHNSHKTSVSKYESAIIKKNKGKRPQKASSRYALGKTVSETKKKTGKENQTSGPDNIKLSTSPVEDSTNLKGKRENSPVKSKEGRGRKSIFNLNDSPRPSQGGKGKAPNLERPKSINYDRKKSLSPGFRIEFDPISSGTITEAMQEFALLYNVPVNQLSKLTDGILHIEPEDRKDSGKKKFSRRKTEEGLSKVKALRIKSDEKEINSRKSVINKSV